MEVVFWVVVLACTVIAVALLLLGDREQDIVDEEPTLDTRGPDDRP